MNFAFSHSDTPEHVAATIMEIFMAPCLKPPGNGDADQSPGEGDSAGGGARLEKA
jgi:hypothetical protein